MMKKDRNLYISTSAKGEFVLSLLKLSQAVNLQLGTDLQSFSFFLLNVLFDSNFK